MRARQRLRSEAVVSGAGPLSLAITPAWDAFYRASDKRGANLDVSVELRDNAIEPGGADAVVRQE